MEIAPLIKKIQIYGAETTPLYGAETTPPVQAKKTTAINPPSPLLTLTLQQKGDRK
jgi:hypothetical protein